MTIDIDIFIVVGCIVNLFMAVWDRDWHAALGWVCAGLGFIIVLGLDAAKIAGKG